MRVEKKVRIWRIVKIPLIALITLIVAAAIAVTLFYLIRGAKIKNSLAENRAKVSYGTTKSFNDGFKSIKSLLEKYPERGDILSAAAWAYAFGAYIYGPADTYLKESKKYLGRVGTGDRKDLFWAASALDLILDARAEEASMMTKEKLPLYKDSQELEFVSALAMAASGKTMEATIELEVLRTRSRPYIPAMLALSNIKQKSGDANGSQLVLLDILARQPDNPSAIVEMALFEIAKGGDSLELAEQTLAKLESELADSPPIIYTKGYQAKGKLAIARGNFLSAIEALEKAHGMTPDDPGIVYELALAYRMARKPLSALNLLSGFKDLKKCPTNILREIVQSNLLAQRMVAGEAAVKELLQRYDTDRSEVYYLSGLVHASSLNPADAIKDLESAGAFADTKIRLALLLTEVGKLRESTKILKELRTGKDKCATFLYDRLVKKGLSTVEKDENLPACPADVQAAILLEAGSYTKMSDLLKLETQKGELPWTLYYTAAAALRTMGKKIAREELGKIMKYSPEGIQLLSDITGAYSSMGFFEDAMNTARYCYQANPESPEAHTLFIEAAMTAGKPEDAEKALAAAIKKFPDSPAIVIQKAASDLDKNQASEAANSLEGLMEKDLTLRDLSRAALVLAKAYAAKSKFKDADALLLDTAREIEDDYDPLAAMDMFAELIHYRLGVGGKKYITKAKGAFNGLPQKLYPRAKLFFAGANLKIAEGKTDEAAEYLTKTITADPSFKPAYLELQKLGALNEAQKINFEKIFEEKL